MYLNLCVINTLADVFALVVCVCVHSRVQEGRFHSYCRPTLEPKLSEFCTELTGITQVSWVRFASCACGGAF